MSRTKRLSTLWTQHIKSKENETNEDYKKREAEKSKEDDYDKASWPYLMADRQGQIRALKYIRETIQL